jgi:hypothetical protein
MISHPVDSLVSFTAHLLVSNPKRLRRLTAFNPELMVTSDRPGQKPNEEAAWPEHRLNLTGSGCFFHAGMSS